MACVVQQRMHNSRNVVNWYAKKTLVVMAAKLTNFISMDESYPIMVVVVVVKDEPNNRTRE
eukprot:scaffold382109_cov35-Attheya_sp.AAC.1